MKNIDLKPISADDEMCLLCGADRLTGVDPSLDEASSVALYEQHFQALMQQLQQGGALEEVLPCIINCPRRQSNTEPSPTA